MKDFFSKTPWAKYLLAGLAIFLVRLIPFRAPNVEPLLATVMPFSKRFGVVGSFLFAFLSIGLFDAVTSGIGIWTLVTAVAYGVLAVGSYYFFKSRAASVKNFLIFGVIGTILYDVATGFTIGPIFFHQPFMAAVIGQIPFTLLHLAGTIGFSIFLSPVLYRWVATNDAFEFSALGRNRTYITSSAS